jgi:hypothetical protein
MPLSLPLYLPLLGHGHSNLNSSSFIWGYAAALVILTRPAPPQPFVLISSSRIALARFMRSSNSFWLRARLAVVGFSSKGGGMGFEGAGAATAGASAGAIAGAVTGMGAGAGVGAGATGGGGGGGGAADVRADGTAAGTGTHEVRGPSRTVRRCIRGSPGTYLTLPSAARAQEGLHPTANKHPEQRIQ